MWYIAEGPRLVAAAQSVGMPAVIQQTPVLHAPAPAMTQMAAGGTPIILAPRIPTPAAHVTSLPSQATVLAAAAAANHTPSPVVPPAASISNVPTSNLVYSYDAAAAAYLHRVLGDYSNAVDSSAGKCQLTSAVITTKCLYAAV